MLVGPIETLSRQRAWRALPLLFLSLAGCGRDQFTVQMFTFPGEVPAHETGWEYRGVITVSTAERGSMFNRSDKGVRIDIFDKNGNERFNDTMKLQGISDLKATVDWQAIDDLTITLTEHGSENVPDEYSQRLARSGARPLGVIRLKRDRDTGRFSASAPQ